MRRGAGVFIANVVKCRPPGNRDPLPEEIAACRPYREAQLELRKRPGLPNQLIEKIPNTPERRRPEPEAADTKVAEPLTTSGEVK